MKSRLSVTAISVRLAALGALLGTAAWAPAAIGVHPATGNGLLNRDNCAVRTVSPESASTVELPWFLRATTAPAKSNAAATARAQADQNARTTANQMSQSLKFIQNKGQVVDQNNHTRSDVAFYGSTRSA